MKIRKYTRIGCGLMKIAIIGSAGSGKSTLARRIGEKLKLPVFHMDTLFWKPGWEAVSTEELTENHDQILKNPSWVIDGNYHKVWGKRMEAADLIIFLDLPRATCLYRAIKRFFQYRKKARPDMTVGCEEKLDWEFIRYIWKYPKTKRYYAIQVIELYKNRKSTIILHNKEEIDNFLAHLSYK